MVLSKISNTGTFKYEAITVIVPCGETTNDAFLIKLNKSKLSIFSRYTISSTKLDDNLFVLIFSKLIVLNFVQIYLE